MADNPVPPPRKTPAQLRAERLAVALRANLKRRKAQARDRVTEQARHGATESQETPLTPPGETPKS